MDLSHSLTIAIVHTLESKYAIFKSPRFLSHSPDFAEPPIPTSSNDNREAAAMVRAPRISGRSPTYTLRLAAEVAT